MRLLANFDYLEGDVLCYEIKGIHAKGGRIVGPNGLAFRSRRVGGVSPLNHRLICSCPFYGDESFSWWYVYLLSERKQKNFTILPLMHAIKSSLIRNIRKQTTFIRTHVPRDTIHRSYNICQRKSIKNWW